MATTGARTAALLLLTFGAACYRYVPVDPASVAPGMGVRARLTLEKAAEVPDYVTQGRLLVGTLLERNGTELVIEVPVAQSLRGMRVESIHQRIRVDRAGLVELERRELDSGRTSLAVGGAGVAAVGLALTIIFSETGADTKPDLPPGPDDAIVFSIPFGPGR